MKKIIISLILGVVVVGLIYMYRNSETSTDVSSQDQVPSISISNWQTYRDVQEQFSLKYPLTGVTTNKSLLRQTSQGNLSGASFSLPNEYWNGTNLSSDSSISIELAPATCSASLFISSSGKNDLTSAQTINGARYTKITHSESAAGNSYKEIVYFISQDSAHNPCSGIRLFLHSYNLRTLQENDPTIKSYDEARIMSFFDQVASTVNFTVAE